MNMDDILNIEKVLDYCDVPQLFIARDAFDTLFICLLYEDDPVCKYTGIKISSKKLNNFYDGKCIYVHYSSNLRTQTNISI